jgi:hypothetical protein
MPKKFTSEYQPSREAKSKGALKRHAGERLLNAVVGDGDLKEAAEKMLYALGIEVDEVTVEWLMYLAQIQKAVQQGDTNAFNAVMDRVKGKPKQSLEVEAKEPPPILDTNGLLDE